MEFNDVVSKEQLKILIRMHTKEIDRCHEENAEAIAEAKLEQDILAEIKQDDEMHKVSFEADIYSIAF